MPFVCRTEADCFRKFSAEMRTLVQRVLLTSATLKMTQLPGNLAELSFASPPQLASRIGQIRLVLRQRMDTEPDGRQFRLRTLSYNYGIQPAGSNEDVIRWDYIREHDDDWGRHHVHVSAESDGEPFGRLHLPTGPVLIEDVLRFLIVDLDVPKATNWREILSASETAFHEEKRPRGAWGKRTTKRVPAASSKPRRR